MDKNDVARIIDNITLDILTRAYIKKIKETPLVNPFEKFKRPKQYTDTLNINEGMFRMDSKKQVLHKLDLICKTSKIVASRCNCNVKNMYDSISVHDLACEIEKIVANNSYRFLHMVGGKRVLKCGTMYVESYERMYGDSDVKYKLVFTSSVDEAVNVDMSDVDSLLKYCPMLDVKEIRMVEM